MIIVVSDKKKKRILNFHLFLDNYNIIVEKDNKLFELEIPENEEEEIEDINYYVLKEIEDNYDTYKDKLHKYTYTFINKDGNYLLQSFKYER